MSYPSMRHPLASIRVLILVVAVLAGGACHAPLTPSTESFAFEVDGNRLAGPLDRPTHRAAGPPGPGATGAPAHRVPEWSRHRAVRARV